MISNRLNVLQVMDYATSYPGNFIRSLEMLEKQLLLEGGKMVYVFPERAQSRDWVKAMMASGKPVYFISRKTGKAAALLRKLISQHNISIIHSHFAPVYLYLPIRLARLGQHNIPHFVHAHSQPKRQKKPLLDFIRNFLIDEKLYICVSEAVAKEYENRGRVCEVVRNAIDLTRLINFESLNRYDYSDSANNKLVLMLGWDFKIKGIDFAMETLAKFDKEHEIILLICIATLIEQAKEKIIDIFGEIPKWIKLLPPRDDIATYYKLADVFASASRTEGFNYALVEAAYCGTPIVASDIPGQNELKIPFTAEFESENGEQFFYALNKLLSRAPGQSAAESFAAKEFVTATFAMDKWTQNIINIYLKYIK